MGNTKYYNINDVKDIYVNDIIIFEYIYIVILFLINLYSKNFIK
jgi:hypothetical protein